MVLFNITLVNELRKLKTTLYKEKGLSKKVVIPIPIAIGMRNL